MESNLNIDVLNSIIYTQQNLVIQTSLYNYVVIFWLLFRNLQVNIVFEHSHQTIKNNDLL